MSDYFDRVGETFTTTGTGAITLLGARARFKTVASRFADALVRPFLLEDPNGSDWEVSLCTISASGTVLTRTTVLASSNSDAAVSFAAGTKYVTHIVPAAYIPLANFTEAKNSASPNATVPVVSLSAYGSDTNLDFTLKPKGTGALLAQVADGTTAGGDKRGTYAVDWQRLRENSSAVASGNWSTIGGGYDNEATAPLATVAGGEYNIASNDDATVAGGYDNQASGKFSFIAGGRLGTTRGIYGAFAHASGGFDENVWGDAQYRRFVLRKSTTNATPGVLTANGAAAATTNQVVLPDTSSYTFSGMVTARQPATGDTKGWTFSGVIRRGANAAATALVAAVTPTVVAGDSGASTWSLAVSADTANGGLAVTATGENSKTIQWVASVDTVETLG